MRKGNYFVVRQFDTNTPIEKAINMLGGVTLTSQRLQCSKSAVSLWLTNNNVPIWRAVQLEDITGIPAKEFIKDNYKKLKRLKGYIQNKEKVEL